MARWQRKQRRTDTQRRLEPPRPTERPPWPAEQGRSSEPPATTSEPQVVVRKADVVVRLAYNPTQAAQAVGVSRSSLYRFLPYLETIETPSGHPLIPVDELERVAAERRQAALARRAPTPPGRKPCVPPSVLARIRAARGDGRSYRQIAAELNADGTPTAHNGKEWWPSTVRAVLQRAVRASAAPPVGPATLDGD
jgi:hypothetical protein